MAWDTSGRPASCHATLLPAACSAAAVNAFSARLSTASRRPVRVQGRGPRQGEVCVWHSMWESPGLELDTKHGIERRGEKHESQARGVTTPGNSLPTCERVLEPQHGVRPAADVSQRAPHEPRRRHHATCRSALTPRPHPDPDAGSRGQAPASSSSAPKSGAKPGALPCNGRADARGCHRRRRREAELRRAEGVGVLQRRGAPSAQVHPGAGQERVLDKPLQLLQQPAQHLLLRRAPPATTVAAAGSGAAARRRRQAAPLLRERRGRVGLRV